MLSFYETARLKVISRELSPGGHLIYQPAELTLPNIQGLPHIHIDTDVAACSNVGLAYDFLVSEGGDQSIMFQAIVVYCHFSVRVANSLCSQQIQS